MKTFTRKKKIKNNGERSSLYFRHIVSKIWVFVEDSGYKQGMDPKWPTHPLLCAMFNIFLPADYKRQNIWFRAAKTNHYSVSLLRVWGFFRELGRFKFCSLILNLVSFVGIGNISVFIRCGQCLLKHHSQTTCTICYSACCIGPTTTC